MVTFKQFPRKARKFTFVWSLSIVFFFILDTLYAEKSGFEIGIAGGFNICWMQGSEIDGYEEEYSSVYPNEANNFIIHCGYELKKWLQLESGIAFSGNGLQFDIERQSGINIIDHIPQSVTAFVSLEREVTLLEFPVLLRIQTPFVLFGNYRIFGFGGIRPGVVIKAAEKITQTANGKKKLLQETDLLESRIIRGENGKQLPYTFRDFHNRNTVSFSCGGGVERELWKFGVFGQVHYIHGMKNFNRFSEKARRDLVEFNSDSPSSTVKYLGEPEALFRSLQFSAGINFFPGKE